MQKIILIVLIMSIIIVPNVFAELKEFNIELEVDINNHTVVLDTENGISKEYIITGENYSKDETWRYSIYRDIDLEDTTNTNSKINNLSNYINNLDSSIEQLSSDVIKGQNYFDLYTDCATELITTKSSYEVIKSCPDEKNTCQNELDKGEDKEKECSEDYSECSRNEDLLLTEVQTLTDELEQIKTQRYVWAIFGLIIGGVGYKFLFNKTPTGKNPIRPPGGI